MIVCIKRFGRTINGKKSWTSSVDQHGEENKAM